MWYSLKITRLLYSTHFTGKMHKERGRGQVHWGCRLPRLKKKRSLHFALSKLRSHALLSPPLPVLSGGQHLYKQHSIPQSKAVGVSKTPKHVIFTLHTQNFYQNGHMMAQTAQKQLGKKNRYPCLRA